VIEITGIPTRQQLHPLSNEGPLGVNDASVLLAPKAQQLPRSKRALQTGGHGGVRGEALHAPIRLTAGDMFSCTGPQSFRSKIDAHVAKTLENNCKPDRKFGGSKD
jgi:hypothetical protein